MNTPLPAHEPLTTLAEQNIDRLDQMRYDPLTRLYTRLAPSNKYPAVFAMECRIRWFKYTAVGQYACVDGGSGADADGCFKARDITPLDTQRATLKAYLDARQQETMGS